MIIFQYIVPTIVFMAVGGAAGVLLAFASRALEVEADDTIDRIYEKLPGINCGACGMSSCEQYAEGVIKHGLAPNLCKPGGPDAAAAIGAALGIEVKPQERESAYVHCSGVTSDDKFIYNGAQTCAAAGRYYKGRINCESGCLGYGDCAKVCVYEAVNISNGIAVIDPQKCWACGLCVNVCPNKLISLHKHSERIKVRCSSHHSGKDTRKFCSHGCIACKLCEKKCLKDAVKVVDNCAVIDYEKCTYCEVCAVVCPAKCIVTEPRRWRGEV